MKVDVLLGLQWGDEGKGKIVDFLSKNYQAIARFQGGANAGHTLEFDNIKHVLHIIPSGIFQEDVVNIIGNGLVIDPVILKNEIEVLNKMGIDVKSRLKISQKAHLILPTHKLLDAALEQSKQKAKIGSTLKGIGPTYTDKISRNGLRVGDSLKENFKTKYSNLVDKHKKLLDLYNFEYNLAELEQEWFEAIELLKILSVIDSEYYINKLINDGKKVLAEGAQGTLLDVEFGSYPFVTSSNTVSAGACTGLGIPPNGVGEIIGIFKAYCTRVGNGPFPTELSDEVGDALRKLGNEFGATTGRPRRCGWLDLPALKYAIMLNGVTQLVITKIDVLNSLETIKVCTHYNYHGEEIDYLPFGTEDGELTPVYKEFPGWQEDTDKVSSIAQIPDKLKDYLNYLEAELKIPIKIVSVGPNRKQTIVC